MRAKVTLLVLLTALLLLTSCSYALIPKRDLLEFREQFYYLTDRVSYPNEQVREGAMLMRRTLDNWCKPFLEGER